MTSIMSCADPRDAKAKILALTTERTPRYSVFDVIAMPGRDYVTRKSLRERRTLISNLSSRLAQWSKFVHRATSLEVGEISYQEAIAFGHEGVVIKDLESRYVYGSCGAWVKIKPEREGTVQYVTAEQGEGKYAQTLGAIFFRGVLEGRHVSGTVSGMTDAQRDYIWTHRDECIGRKFDVIYERISPDGHLIHPRFDRWRDDI